MIYISEDEIPDCDFCDRPVDYSDAINDSDTDILIDELNGRGYKVFDEDYFEEEAVDKLKELGYIIYKKSR